MSESVEDSHMTGPGPFQPEHVLIAIPALNEAAHIESCIRSLLGGDPDLKEVRLVVADGGSQDNTADIVRALTGDFPNIRLIDNPQKYQSAGVNAVVRDCAEDSHIFLVRCDAHSVYPPGYVRQIIDTFQAIPDAASVATVMDATGDACFQRASAWIVDTPFGSGGSAHRGGSRSGWVDHAHHAGFRLDWFRRIGGYDPGFTHNEDAEYDHRLGLAGGRVWLATEIRMDYQMRPTPRGLIKQYWSYGKGRARTLLKHRMRPRLRQLIPVLNLLLIAFCLMLSGLLPVLLLWPFLYLLALIAISVQSVLSMRSLCGLWAGVALAIIHNAWALGFLSQLGRWLFRR
jgi:succinoglycan biosynthesis protein ExoA